MSCLKTKNGQAVNRKGRASGQETAMTSDQKENTHSQLGKLVIKNHFFIQFAICGGDTK